MRWIHTSDWHLGRSLYGRHRYPEYKRFLAWLVEIIARNGVDALLVSGDIFDNGTPSNRALQMYYRFLRDVREAGCRHVVIIGGNHDSPSLLEAPRALLEPLDVRVVGQAREDSRDEVFVLRDEADQPEAIVCAVPFLRDRDLRSVEPGESSHQKQRKLGLGIKAHYQAVCLHAQELRRSLEANIPMIVMGHLFTTGGKTLEDDGVRDLYVGHQGDVAPETFPPELDYLALGHLHVPQTIGDATHMRYCGSPLPIGFGEAEQKKIVVQVDWDDGVSMQPIEVPRFQRLARLSGDWECLCNRMTELAQEGESVWLDLLYEGEPKLDLREAIEERVRDTPLEVLAIKQHAISRVGLEPAKPLETLDDMRAIDVFRRCLQDHGVAREHWDALEASFQRAQNWDETKE